MASQDLPIQRPRHPPPHLLDPHIHFRTPRGDRKTDLGILDMAHPHGPTQGKFRLSTTRKARRKLLSNDRPGEMDGDDVEIDSIPGSRLARHCNLDTDRLRDYCGK